jgi:sugar phosphate isomerase/epimerase
MKREKIAAQLYTLRDHLKSPAQIVKTLRQVRKIGYQAVQLAGLCQIDSSELARILDGEGLVCCATHENSATILEHPEAIAEKLHLLGCTYVAYPYPSEIDTWTLRTLRSLTRRLESAGKVLLESGKVLTYHNHEVEFYRIKGRTILEQIYDSTHPELLQGEIDTHWVQAGGGCPVAWCRRLSGRLPLVHLQDYAVASDGHRRFVVEQAGDWVDNDPFRSLSVSLRYLVDHFVD